MNKRREEVLDQFDELVKHSLDLDFSGIVAKKWSERPEDQELCSIIENFLKSLRHVQEYINYNKEDIKKEANIYGEGKTAERIKKIIMSSDLTKLIKKGFYDNVKDDFTK